MKAKFSEQDFNKDATNHGLAAARNRLWVQMVQGAARYAKSQRSDPFALQRAMLHISSDKFQPFDDDGNPCWYDAERVMVTRFLPEGVTFSDGLRTYEVEEWRNMRRI